MASTNDQLSKRARQKAHRDAQRAAQQAAAARARRNRLIAIAGVALLVLAGVGVTVQRQLAARAAVQAERREVAARLASLECTEDTAQPNLGGGHLDVQGPQNVVANPPEAVYPERPATSGPHISSVVKTGVYDTRIDERILVHNLEHGYVIAYYAPSAPADQVTALKDWAQTQIDGAFPKTIVAPWTGGPLAGDANFAYTAWNFRQLCGQFDPQVASLFATSHSGGSSRAPESSLAPHLSEGTGIADPSTSDLLLPPLDQQLGDEGAPPAPEPAPAPPPTEPAPAPAPPPSS
ncbi:MAG: DUF3105 domain-containing protein [Egibacteraceae bacterium]